MTDFEKFILENETVIRYAYSDLQELAETMRGFGKMLATRLEHISYNLSEMEHSVNYINELKHKKSVEKLQKK